MKFLKNNLKLIIGILIGAILTGGIVYAATSAREITYTTDKNAEIATVEDALNDLYKKKNINIEKTISTRDNTYTYTFDKNYSSLCVVFRCGNASSISITPKHTELYNMVSTNTSQLAVYMLEDVKIGDTISFQLSYGNYDTVIWFLL